ncbi:MFS transporter [Dyadobacter sp. CY323]|uniref:MFS transporter n=1 Tax=Dyadobacter sp. CY323 TaxID=2907302 RepID=UPI001F16F11C|nr:MFS transporter [Dyadobacter sp. CY323]MCE6988558.1 MFS transporter [Dyadobacter sp. CY323]
MSLISIEKGSRRYAWLIVGLLSVVGCLNYLDRMMITTMRFSIVDSIPMTDAQFGLLTSLFLWIYGFLSPMGGFLADRFKRSWVIIGSLFVWSLVTLLTSYVTTYEGLLLTRALMGISEACYIPAGLALIMDYHKGATRSLANGIHMAGIMIGQSLGFVGGWLAETHSWNYAFLAFGLFGIVYALILTVLLREAPKDVVQAEIHSEMTSPDVGVDLRGAIRALFFNRQYITTLLFWGTGGIVVWLVTGWLPTYFKEHFNLSQSMAGVYSTGYIYTAALLGVLTGGFLADRWAKRNPRARMLVPAIGLLIAAPAIFFASLADTLAFALPGFVAFGFFRVFLDANMMPMLTQIVDRRLIATAYGILNFISCLVGGVSLYAGGWLRDMNVDVGLLFRISSVCMVVMAALLYTLKPKPDKLV